MNAIAELLGGGTAAGAIARTFDLMGIAEEEIRRAGGRNRKGDAVWNSFGELNPGFLVDFGPELYRLHCRELIARAKSGSDMRPGTQAEVLAFLSSASLKAPPSRDFAALQTRIFCWLFPDSAVAKETTAHQRDGSYAGALDEIEDALVRKLARNRRPS